MRTHDAVIIGGGPAGLAAAVQLKKKGIDDILIIEREKHLGGILRQCIHDGFGLTRFGVTLSGPEYSQRFIDMAQELGVSTITNATVIDLSGDRVITAATQEGLLQVQGKAVILTMGCRERTRGALAIPGSRPAGVFNAGVTQSYVNLYNTMVGKEVLIMGSGDIGLIMARRLTLEGAKVKGVFEIMPYPSGLPRNIEQCLNDYDIPLYLSHSVVEIMGNERIEGVRVVQVDENFRPVEGTEKYFSCDTLVLSVGLIPENEISLAAGVELDKRTNGAVVDEFYQANVPGIFAAGNVLHVHDLVDFVSKEAEAMADGVSEYLKNGGLPECRLEVKAGSDIGHLIPQWVSGERDFKLSMRVRRPWGKCCIEVRQGDTVLKQLKLAKAIPAEMTELVIPAEKMNTRDDLEVRVYEI